MDKSKKLDDSIDFNKLQEEFTRAISSDEKYQRENDAKFRAIHQKVASYDEFRDIVLASHLKPLDKKDKTGGMNYQGWNAAAMNMRKEADTPASEKTTDTDNASRTIPKTSAEFDKTWKRTCKGDKERFQYLIEVGSENLRKILTTECPLGQMITVINSSDLLERYCQDIVDILGVLAKTKRFSLALDFLDDSEKQELKDLFYKCKCSLENAKASLEKFELVSKQYGLV